MDVVWLILDSLNFDGTSFAPDGPNTTPELERLAEDHGVVFTEAYVPGPASPSSHSSFFTGKLPSETGMTEAFPYFDGRMTTIAEAMRPTHATTLVSVNPFLFNGLERGFDSVEDPAADQFLLFESGRDPRQWESDFENPLLQQLDFVVGERPLRSAANGLSYKLWRRRGNDFIPTQVDDTAYQYADEISSRIRDAVARDAGDSFVVANFMDIHHPYDASHASLAEFTPDGVTRENLPIGVRKEHVDERDHDLLYSLYLASVKDTDRKVAPLVERLVEHDALVVVTADHGPALGWDYLSDEQLHVPLLVFAPDHSPGTVDHTVNVRSLPATTAAVAGVDADFEGENLLEVSADTLSITEHIHHASELNPGPVTATGTTDDTVRYHAAAVRGDTKVILRDGDREVVRDEGTTEADELADVLRERHTHQPWAEPSRSIEYDEETKQRLEDLGYL